MKKFSLIFLLCFVIGHICSEEHYDSDSIYVMGGKKYHLSTQDLGEDQDELLLTVTSEGKSILKCKKFKSFGGWSLEDFDGDGYLDIIYSHSGNNTIYELYLFSSQKNEYIEVEGFMEFPEAQPLKKNSRYYYSYHRAGCADMNWVSDLFKIENYKTIHLGHIYGRGCEFLDENDDAPKIYISKIVNNESEQEVLVRTILFEDEFFQSSDGKWDFIDKYWNANYQLFR